MPMPMSHSYLCKFGVRVIRIEMNLVQIQLNKQTNTCYGAEFDRKIP